MKSLLVLLVSRLKAWFSRKAQSPADPTRSNSFEALEPRILYSAAPVEAPEPAPAEVGADSGTAQAVEAPAPAAQAPAAEEGSSAAPASNGEAAAAPEPVGATAIPADQEVSLVDVSEDSRQSVSFQAAEDTENMQLSLDADGNVQISENGVVTFRQSAGSIRDLSIHGNALDNHLTVDFSNGSPVPELGLSYHGHGNVTDYPGDALSVTGLAAGTDVTYETAETTEEGAGFNGTVRVGDDKIQFFGLEPMTFIGAGGTLTSDATATPATTTLTVGDLAPAGDGINRISGDGGFEETTFSGFDNLVLRGGDGEETITLNAIDVGGAPALATVTLDGNNTAATDAASVDTFDLVGPFAGDLTVQSDDNDIIRVAGAGDGAFVVNNATLGAGSVRFDINGTTAGTNHDTITATTVDITGATLDISGAHAAATGEQFTLISTTGGVTGTFAGLAEGATISNFLGSGLDATITYAGGGGNDVVLTVSAPRPATDDTYLVANTGTTTLPASAGVLSNDNFITTANLTLNYDANDPASAVGSNWRGGVASNDWNFGGDVTLQNVTGGNNTRAGITNAYRFTNGPGAENQGLNDLAGDPSNDSATWEFWLRPDDLNDGNQIIFETGGSGDGMAIIYQKGTDNDGVGNIRFTVDDGGTQRHLTGAIDRSDFHHVVAVYSKDDPAHGGNDRVELYIDGVSVAVNATATNLDDWDGGDPSGLGNLGAGGLAQGSANGEFDGDISVFRFYEAALTESEIQNNFNAVATPNTVTEINGVGANVGNPVVLTNGTVTVNADGSLSYTATTGGNDSFAYTASDGVNLYAATVTLNQIANTAPVANDDPGETTNESTAILIDVLANDVDPDAGQSRIVTVPATSANGVPLTVTASGEVRYDPTVALDGLVGGGILVDTFTYTFSDGIASDTATVTVTVSGESDTGVAGDDTATTDEDTTVSGNVLINDTDIDSVTAGADLNFDASADLDGAEWENTGHDAAGWVLNSDAGTAPVLTAVTSSHAGITQAYQMTGGATGGNNAFKLQDGNGTDRSLGNLNNDATDESATFEIWFKPDSLPNTGNRQILFEDGGGTGIGLFIEGNNLVAKKLPGSATGDRLAVDISALAGDFIQAVLTFDRATNPDQMELFVNGTSAGTFGTNNGGDWSGGDPLAVGGRGGANTGGQGGGDSGSVSFQGQVAAFRFYRNQVLDLAEVNQNYRAVHQGNILRVSEVEGQAADVGNEITLASGAKVTLNANGTFDYNPNGAFEHLTAFQSTTDSFEYTVSDGVDSTTATVTVTLDGINDLPIARDNPQIWRVGIDNGNNSEFPNEGANTDEHYYFAGTYPSRADGSSDVSPSADEAFNTFDRALTNGDPNNFIHFNLTPDQADDNLRLTVDVVQSNIPAGGIDFEVLFNGVSVLSQNLTADGVLTADFTAASVSATTGENIIEVRRTDGNGGWMQFDHITLQSVDEINAYTTDEDNSLTVPNPGVTGNDFDADTTVQILSADTTSAAGAAVSVIGQTNIGEVGQLTVDGSVQTVTLNQTYTNAVVIAMVEQATNPTPNDDPNAANARVFNVTGNSFDIQLQSPASGSPGFPIAETVNYIVLEAGTYQLANGARLEAGTIAATATGNNNIAFTGGQFSTTPVALTQVMSNTDSSYVNSRHQANVSETGVDIFLEPAQGAPAHASGETIGFVAIEQSFGTIGSLLYEVGVTGNIADADGGAVTFINTYTTAPLFVGSQQTINGSDASGTRFRYNGTGVIVESDEDRVFDTETGHAAEAIGFFAFEATTGFLQGVAVGGTTGGFTYNPGSLFQNLGENDTATDTFEYTITDGMGETDTATVTVTINGVNDAPVLASNTGDFNSVSISDYTNDGDLVSTLINGQISDVDDNSVEGIAVTGIMIDAPGTGKFQFSTDDGDNWSDFGAVSDLAALLLRAEDRIRFVPDGSNLTGGTVSFRAWDQTGTTAGDQGTSVDITNDFSGGGGSTPFSLATESSSVAVANLVKDGNDLIYSASDGAGNVNHLSVSIDQSTGELVIVDTNGNPVTTSSNLVDNDPSANGARVAYNGENLTIRTGIADDIISFALMDGFSGALTVEGGADYDQVFLSGSTFDLAAGNDASLDAERINAISTNINTTGGGAISITGTGGTTNNFAGIYMVSSGLSSEGGVITLDGTGSNSGFYAHGIELNSTTISSDSTEDTAISITGKGGLGGSGDYSNSGVNSFYASITASNGGVVIDGSADSTTTSSFNAGVALYATTVSGTTLDVTGVGGGGVSYNRGIFLSSNSDLDATDGDATLIGSNAANNTNGSYNDGIYVEGSSVDATGKLTIDGTGSTSPTNGSNNNGVHLFGSTANGGNGLDIDGVGGTGSGGYNYGVNIYSSTATGGSGDVTIDGTANSTTAGYYNVGTAIQYTTTSGASLAINGTGGGGTFYNRGVLMTGGSATAASGDITIVGDSANNTSGGGNDGVQINSMSVTASSGKIDIDGSGSTGVANTSANNGVYLSGATLSSSELSVVGTGGVGSGIDNNGVYLFGGSITTTGTADTVITGNGGTGAGGYNYGAYLYSITINANNSTLDIDGTASSTAGGTNNTGVGLQYSILNGDAVLVTGNGGSGTNYNRGIYIVGGSATADNGNADFLGTANAAAAGAYNEGINATSTSITSSAGSALLRGDGGTSGSNSHSNHGVYFTSVTANGSAGTSITGNGGTGSSGFSSGATIYYGSIGVNSSATTITGVANAGAGGSFNVGTSLQYATVVGSTLNVNGTGGGNGGSNRGVYILGGSATAASGAMTVIGSSNSTVGSTNNGVEIQNATIGGSASTSITGSGGGGSDYNHGIFMNAITTFGVTPFTANGTGGTGTNSEDETGDFFPQ